MFEIAMLTGFLFAAFSQLLPAGPHAPPGKFRHGSATGRGTAILLPGRGCHKNLLHENNLYRVKRI